MLSNLWLGVRILAMVALFPGTVTIYIPYRILGGLALPTIAAWSTAHYVGTLLVIVGTVILLHCVWSFARVGRGTLAPFDETKKLVVVGLYRYVRNPMYVGVTIILLGEAIFFWSNALLAYSALMFVLFNLLIIGFEEHRLRYKYGDEYRRYCRAVGRWLPGRPYEDAG